MADRLTAPTALEEHRKLAVFAGEWSGDEMVFPSRWTEGGKATAQVKARIDLNGFYLIQDTVQTRDGKEKVAAAFKIITADPKVEGILVNIFGGIMKCDVIAEGVIAAVKEVGLKVPLVVRLEGTNVDLGKKIINESGLNVISANDLDDAAQKIVAAVKGA